MAGYDWLAQTERGFSYRFSDISYEAGFVPAPPVGSVSSRGESSVVSTDDGNLLGILLSRHYRKVFEFVNMQIDLLLDGYQSFVMGQAVSIDGRFMRVYYWEYNEMNNQTRITAYGVR